MVFRVLPHIQVNFLKIYTSIRSPLFLLTQIRLKLICEIIYPEMAYESYLCWILGVNCESMRNIVVKIILLALVFKFELLLVAFLWNNHNMDPFLEREFHKGTVIDATFMPFNLLESFDEILRKAFNADLKLLNLLLFMNKPGWLYFISSQGDPKLLEDLNKHSEDVYLKIWGWPLDHHVFRKWIELLLLLSLILWGRWWWNINSLSPRASWCFWLLIWDRLIESCNFLFLHLRINK